MEAPEPRAVEAQRTHLVIHEEDILQSRLVWVRAVGSAREGHMS